VILTGHAFMQNLRRGHYELSLDAAGADNLVRPGSGRLGQHRRILFLSTCLGPLKSLKVTE
jgi:hypothetical protein